MAPHLQDHVQEHSLRDPESFWTHQAEQVQWHKKPIRALMRPIKKLANGTTHPSFSWFPDGEISTCYNCVDRHVKAGNGNVNAIIWDSPVAGSKEKYTYRQLLSEVETLAGVLREEGVEKGDVVVAYMPMIPAALFAILAISRLGAIHAVVFGGFSAASLAQRIEASKPKVIMTASCGIEGAKGPLNYKPFIEGAVEKSTFKPEKIIVWQRDELRWDPIVKENGERNWQRCVKSARNRGLKADGVPVKSNDGVYIIYTSGTTGSPKGVLREAGGHVVGLNFSIRYLFGIHPGDVMFCASDIGWVVGHSYILYAPLLAGATTVLFEGKPVGTPDASTFWRILAEHRVNVLFTAPTALRAIRREDPTNSFFAQAGHNNGLRQLRALFLAGERSEPSLIRTYQHLLASHCATNAQVIDNWWSSESGSPMTGVALHPAAGQDFNSPSCSSSSSPLALPTLPGSAGKPLPGFDIRIVSDTGTPLPPGEMGNIVLALPLAPTGFTTLFNDPLRFYNGYLKRFDGRWLDTGDAGMIDRGGYVHVMSRSDDIINVAAHRFSTGAIEQAVAAHPGVAECCVVGMPDALKGHVPFAFVTLSSATNGQGGGGRAIPSEELMKEVQARIVEEIGSVAKLGGMVVGPGMIPRTRSGKTLRRVLRELVEMEAEGRAGGEVNVPATVEDGGVVEVARRRVGEWFAWRRGQRGGEGTEKAKL